MRGRGAPLRFVAATVTIWVSARILFLTGEQVETPAIASTPVTATAERKSALSAIVAGWLYGGNDIGRAPPYSLTLTLPARSVINEPKPKDPPYRKVEPVLLAAARPELLAPQPPATPPRLNLADAVTQASRFSGSAWLFVRSKADGRSLATSGQLGGSQGGARLRWRINPGAELRTALYGRLSSPLDHGSGAEAAVGAEWHPLPGQPVWIAAERRIAVEKQGRNAWSLYAAGGIWKPGLPMQFTLDGYAQAGVVGTHRRDLFADGSLRLSRPLVPNGPRVGAGAWGAAQPGVSRLDIGPHASVPISVARQPLSLSADMRFRVAGRAAPGSGVAVTLASDF